MISMTGFGQATAESTRFAVRVTIRTVNHRNLDVHLRLRGVDARVEASLRELLSARLERGRVEVLVEVDVLASDAPLVEVREEAVLALRRSHDDLVARGTLDPGLRFSDLLRVPEVVTVKTPEVPWSEKDQTLLLSTLGWAVDEVVESRKAEGARLREILRGHVEVLRDRVAEIREGRSEVAAESASRLRARLEALLEGTDLDKDRFEQEVALLADRSDIVEELDRLDAHFAHFEEIVPRTGPVGKRLDFLSQEILRELNTAGAKCRESDLTRLVLDAKATCEQFREQVQNIE